MKAIKDNREYTITEDVKESFLKEGYDICDDHGNILEYGAGKTVPFEKFVAVLEAHKKLEEEIRMLRKQLAEKKSTSEKKPKTKKSE